MERGSHANHRILSSEKISTIKAAQTTDSALCRPEANPRLRIIFLILRDMTERYEKSDIGGEILSDHRP